jgi:hypothetical protein
VCRCNGEEEREDKEVTHKGPTGLGGDS